MVNIVFDVIKFCVFNFVVVIIIIIAVNTVFLTVIDIINKWLK